MSGCVLLVNQSLGLPLQRRKNRLRLSVSGPDVNDPLLCDKWVQGEPIVVG